MALDNGDDAVWVSAVPVHAREVCLLTAMIVMATMVAVGGGVASGLAN